MERAGQPDHHHDHDHHNDVPSDVALRVKALESLLVEKGQVDPAALDAIIETYEHKVGPHNGARVVARAWADPAFKQWLLEDGTAAIAELGYAGPQGMTRATSLGANGPRRLPGNCVRRSIAANRTMTRLDTTIIG